LRVESSVEFSSPLLRSAVHCSFCGGVGHLKCKNRPKLVSLQSLLVGHPARLP
jgi:hypothetical protein